MFHDAFRDCDRLENFSYEGRDALYDYLEDFNDCEYCNKGFELDVIALCCEYYEDSIKNVLKEYSLESIEDLEQETTVIWNDDENILYLAY
jgi:hypothetical protein